MIMNNSGWVDVMKEIIIIINVSKTCFLVVSVFECNCVNDNIQENAPRYTTKNFQSKSLDIL